MIRYSFELLPRGSIDAPASRRETGRIVSVQLPRPDWWRDATMRQRALCERKALASDEVQNALAEGLIVAAVRRPVCACSVNKVPKNERDPEWRGASGTCNRCGGPMDKPGKQSRRRGGIRS